jgi:hypothetical protein
VRKVLELDGSSSSSNSKFLKKSVTMQQKPELLALGCSAGSVDKEKKNLNDITML